MCHTPELRVACTRFTCAHTKIDKACVIEEESWIYLNVCTVRRPFECRYVSSHPPTAGRHTWLTHKHTHLPSEPIFPLPHNYHTVSTTPKFKFGSGRSKLFKFVTTRLRGFDCADLRVERRLWSRAPADACTHREVVGREGVCQFGWGCIRCSKTPLYSLRTQSVLK